MKVILLTELKDKGGEGDVVDVAPGFFNNYLNPRRMAVLATKGNLKQLEQRKNNIAKREEKRIADAHAAKTSLEGVNVFVEAKVGEEGVLFGSVTPAMVADAVKAKTGMDIDRKRLEMGSPIKTAGEHVVTLSIYRDIKVELKLLVGTKEEKDALEEASNPLAEEAEGVKDDEGATEAPAAGRAAL